jgi:hypothetical protein
MNSIVVLIVLKLTNGFQYQSMEANDVYQDSKSCEEKLDKIELDIRRNKIYHAYRLAPLLLRVDEKSNENKILYRCLLADGR